MKKSNVLILGLQLLACMPMALVSSELNKGDLNTLGTQSKSGRESNKGEDKRRWNVAQKAKKEISNTCAKQKNRLQVLIDKETDPIERRKLIKSKMKLNMDQRNALNSDSGWIEVPLEMVEKTLRNN